MNLETYLYSSEHIPLESLKRFLSKTLPELQWNQSTKDDVVLDAGCGPGGTTYQLVLPLFPNVKKILAVALVPVGIEFAKKYNSRPLIEYTVDNLEDWSTLEHWEGEISKLISIYCINWLKDQQKAFRNIFKLLKKGGEAAIVFAVESRFYDAILELQNSPKLNCFLKNIETLIPESHLKKRNCTPYKKMSEDTGFEIVYCREEMISDVIPSEERFRNFYSSVCVLTPHVPNDRRKEIKNDFIEELIRQNGWHSNGFPLNTSKTGLNFRNETDWDFRNETNWDFRNETDWKFRNETELNIRNETDWGFRNETDWNFRNETGLNFRNETDWNIRNETDWNFRNETGLNFRNETDWDFRNETNWDFRNETDWNFRNETECYCGVRTASCFFEDNGNKKCVCSYGYGLRQGECVDCDCGRNSLSCHYDKRNNKICKCKGGYDERNGTCAKTCERNFDCTDGRICRQAENNKYFCDCPPNYGGNFCQTNLICANMDPPCRRKGAECVVKDNLAYCRCPPGKKFGLLSGLCE
ncbi:juvenile hormone acid O-methyltransferase, partial [Trichonephila clavata]